MSHWPQEYTQHSCAPNQANTQPSGLWWKCPHGPGALKGFPAWGLVSLSPWCATALHLGGSMACPAVAVAAHLSMCKARWKGLTNMSLSQRDQPPLHFIKSDLVFKHLIGVCMWCVCVVCVVSVRLQVHTCSRGHVYKLPSSDLSCHRGFWSLNSGPDVCMAKRLIG